MDLHNVDEISDKKRKKIRKCGVFMCNNVSGDGISLHLMPQKDDFKRRKDWISSLQLNPRKMSPSFVVCSLHFIDADFINNHKKKRYLKASAKPTQNLPGTKSRKNAMLSKQRSSRIENREINKQKLDADVVESRDESNSDSVNTNFFESEVSPDFPEIPSLFQREENAHSLIKLPSLDKEKISQEELNEIQKIQGQHINSQQTYIEFLHNYIAYLQHRIEFLEKPCETTSIPQNDTFKNSSVQVNASDVVRDEFSHANTSQSTTTGTQVNTMDDFIVSSPTIMDFITNDLFLNMWTGISSLKLLQSIVENIPKYEKRDEYKLDIESRVVLFFIKLKTGLSFSCISSLFRIAISTASKYFYDIIPSIRAVLNFAVYWPSKEEIMLNMPIHFKPNLTNTTAVLDCTEVTIRSFKCTKCKTDSYSHYKGRNTCKFLISVTPAGMINHVSKAYPGRTSDKFIFNNEKLIDKFEPYCDAVMVDKGFSIEKETQEKCIVLHIPPFLKNQKQLTSAQANLNYEIARARVHVERANQRIKIFNIFRTEIDCNILSVIEEVMFIICAIVNLSPPIIGDQYFD